MLMAGAAVQIIQMSVVFNFVLSVLSSGWPWGLRGQVQASAGGSRSEDGPCRHHCVNYSEQEFGVCLHVYVLVCVFYVFMSVCAHSYVGAHVCGYKWRSEVLTPDVVQSCVFILFFEKVLSLNLELTDLPRLTSQRASGSFLSVSSCFRGLGWHICTFYMSNK